MSHPAPAGATCATHALDPAAWCCGRCGAFFCPACERRTRPEALPMCPACWALRERSVAPLKPYSSTSLQTAALVLGCIAVLPIPAVQLAALVVCIVGWVKAKGPAEPARWKPQLGLALAGVGVLIDVLLVAALFR